MKRFLCAVSIVSLLFASGVIDPMVFAGSPGFDSEARPPHRVKNAATTSPTGLTPTQIWHAYGFDQIGCGLTGTTWPNSKLCGNGQVIAIVDAYDNPNIESDLATFNKQFGLPPCTKANGCFTKATPQGGPKFDQTWALETALDVQWAHAIAPGAKILLVEAKSSSLSDLLVAVDYAVKQGGVHQVSMSWGASEFSSVSTLDSHFQVKGVSFFASSGDSGNGAIWPCVSAYVVCVGGTTLNVDSSGNVQSETAWAGSGGGISKYVSEPPYQVSYGISSGGKRGVPDVSYDGDPATGVPIYDSAGYNGQKGWFQVGGTSVGPPHWAALFAIANSGRSAPISSTSFGTGTIIYGAATGTNYALNYRDITSGSNGICGSVCNAAKGYDFVTGLGSPLANNLVGYLRTH